MNASSQAFFVVSFLFCSFFFVFLSLAATTATVDQLDGGAEMRAEALEAGLAWAGGRLGELLSKRLSSVTTPQRDRPRRLTSALAHKFVLH